MDKDIKHDRRIDQAERDGTAAAERAHVRKLHAEALARAAAHHFSRDLGD